VVKKRHSISEYQTKMTNLKQALRGKEKVT